MTPDERQAVADAEALNYAATKLLDGLPEAARRALIAVVEDRAVNDDLPAGCARLSLFVPGKPAPQGSKDFKGFSNAGRAILKESSDAVGPWRERIALAAQHAMREANLPLLQKKFAVHTTITFVMPRPASAPKSYTPAAVNRPDADKLERALNDALTDVVFVDDSQVVKTFRRKVLAEIGCGPGVHISVSSPGWAPELLADAAVAVASSPLVRAA